VAASVPDTYDLRQEKAKAWLRHSPRRYTSISGFLLARALRGARREPQAARPLVLIRPLPARKPRALHGTTGHYSASITNRHDLATRDHERTCFFRCPQATDAANGDHLFLRRETAKHRRLHRRLDDARWNGHQT